MITPYEYGRSYYLTYVVYDNDKNEEILIRAVNGIIQIGEWYEFTVFGPGGKDQSYTAEIIREAKSLIESLGS